MSSSEIILREGLQDYYLVYSTAHPLRRLDGISYSHLKYRLYFVTVFHRSSTGDTYLM